MTKASVDDIRRRFDADVERFSNLDTGQLATQDAALLLDLVTRAAAASTPNARHVLDVGCGAGNYTLKLLQLLPGLDATLVDLSQSMLERAAQRVGAATTGMVTPVQIDVRDFSPPDGAFDVILAAAVLHHLRSASEWQSVFASFYRALRPGGSLWIADLIQHSTPAVQALMWERYRVYLSELKGDAYRDQVLSYIEHEDTPRPLLFQIDQLRAAGFGEVELLHKNGVFAAFGGLKRSLA